MALIGIDLGTTNSLVAVWDEDKVIPIPNAHGELITPSVISVDEQNNIIVGKAAKERMVKYPDATVASFKRRMGTDAICRLNGKKFRAEELSAIILTQLKQDAEEYTGVTITEAVISVPAYFNDTQRNATKRAAELAGLKVERLINEPTAAAIAYGLHDRPDDCHYLILDLGGGTFDVSVLEFFEGIMEVHASAGDNFLGGDDFSDALYNAFLKENDISEKKLRVSEISLIRGQIEKAKKELTSSNSALIKVNLQHKSIDWNVTKAYFEKIIEPLIQRLKHPIERALRDAGLSPNDLDEVILVGGATRMPAIRSLVSKILRRLPMSNLNPDEVVCQGAAIQAALKGKHQALQDVVLTDVSPYSLGIEIAKSKGAGKYDPGHFMPIIERNSVVPVSRVEQVNTIYDKQTELNVEVFQGENRLVRNNIFLGSINIKVPQNKAGAEIVDVRFTYDVNGILEVTVKILSTGEETKRIIENSSVQMTQEQIEESFKKLSNLKVHPRDQAENVALFARGERLYEELLGESRDHISYYLGQFEQALETQDKEISDRAREQLTSILNEIEGEGVL